MLAFSRCLGSLISHRAVRKMHKFPLFALLLGWLLAPTVAQAATATSNLTVQITVTDSCTISAGGSVVNFGLRSIISANLDATTVIAVQCTSSSPWSVGLDNGQNVSGSQRRMTNGSSFVNYNLYTDSGRTNPWLTTSSAGSCTGGAGTCVLGTGNGGFQFITIYGRVPGPQTPVAGFYSDTVIATVTY